MTESTTTSRDKFLKLPEPVKDWLASEQVTLMISGMNKNLDVVGDMVKIIPELILKLALKDVTPESFMKSLERELILEPEVAQKTAEEIRDKILKPVALGLKNYGVDINLIGSGTTPPPPRPFVAGEAPAFGEARSPERRPEGAAIPPAVKPVQQFRVPVDVGPILPELEKPEISAPKEVHYVGKTTPTENKPLTPNG